MNKIDLKKFKFEKINFNGGMVKNNIISFWLFNC